MAMTVRTMVGVMLAAGLVAVRIGTGAAEEFDEKLAWQEVAGSFTTIDFTDFPEGTFITDQYADLGVTFTDGLDFIQHSWSAFPNDGAGLDGYTADIFLEFDHPMHTIAVDFPGDIKFELYAGGDLIYTSSLFGGGGAGFFGGLVVDQSFDMVVLTDPFGEVNIDDLHFGPVPAPASIFPFAVTALLGTRRRRS